MHVGTKCTGMANQWHLTTDLPVHHTDLAIMFLNSWPALRKQTPRRNQIHGSKSVSLVSRNHTTATMHQTVRPFQGSEQEGRIKGSVYRWQSRIAMHPTGAAQHAL